MAVGASRARRPRTRTHTRCASDKARDTFCSTSRTGISSVAWIRWIASNTRVNQRRREVAARLVEQQQPRPQQKREADREHAPLAAAQAARELRSPLARGAGTARSTSAVPARQTLGAEIGAHAQIVGDGEIGEHVLGLRHVADARALPGDARRGR